MSAGRILTLGLGTPFSDVGFLVTLGLGTSAVPPPVVVESTGGGTSKRDKRLKRKVIRFSDLDARERQEALAAIQTRPFTPLEKAAVVLGESDEDDMEDDEILLMAAMRVLH